MYPFRYWSSLIMPSATFSSNASSSIFLRSLTAATASGSTSLSGSILRGSPAALATAFAACSSGDRTNLLASSIAVTSLVCAFEVVFDISLMRVLAFAVWYADCR
uniref:Uncharacterized protein n=1 Tax=Candidatus Methanogaster sp. ANME-2c ERB4 TaxID=2759911 RepID=A0A7G9Y072_9EURY|nr:hypothetical protein EGIHLHMO_00003 [Methanosarcinales archaeon ANME-2c ERB4]